MEDFKQRLYENGYFRQEELVFWDCDRDQRVRVAALLSRLGAFAGYDYDARGLTHDVARTVRWSDLDGNGHLFSGNYGDIIWDALPEDLQAQPPREFQINYSREAVLGDVLRLEGFRSEEGYFVEGLGPRGSCFTALCVF